MSRHNNPLFYTWLVRNAPAGLLEKLATASGTPLERERSWNYRRDPFDPLNGVSLVRFDQDEKGEVRLNVSTAQPSFSMQRIPDFDTLRIATLGEPTTECVFVQLNPQTILHRYEGRLAGLCTVSQSFTHTPDDPRALLPEELRGLDLVNVTDGLTDAHIAAIPDLREENMAKIAAHEHIADVTVREVKMIVLTGDPRVVKSVMCELQKDDWLASKAHFVPQTAQLIAEHFGLKPKTDKPRYTQIATLIDYHRTLRRITLAFEAVSRAQAKAAGKTFLITNGGTLDYYKNPVNQNYDSFESLFGVSSTDEMRRYHRAIFFGPTWEDGDAIGDLARFSDEHTRMQRFFKIMNGLFRASCVIDGMEDPIPKALIQIRHFMG
ncbi:hypothetical protein KBB27_01520 [Patescibacteria group bacterium]|nr:hypothetical protein [Patescibacteria group bacterium]